MSNLNTPEDEFIEWLNESLHGLSPAELFKVQFPEEYASIRRKYNEQIYNDSAFDNDSYCRTFRDSGSCDGTR